MSARNTELSLINSKVTPIFQLKPDYKNIATHIIGVVSLIIVAMLREDFRVAALVLLCFMVTAVLFALSRVGGLDMYEDHMVVTTLFGKKKHRIPYQHIKEFAYQPKAPKAVMSLSIYFHPPLKSPVFDIGIITFTSNVITFEQIKAIYHFLKARDIRFYPLPKSIMHTLEQEEDGEPSK